jgi:hypothetical protein
MDGVCERLAQRAGFDRELGARFRVVATGCAVEDPNPFSRPWQSRSQVPLHDVGGAAEGGEEPRRKSDERDATAGEVGKGADDVGHRDVVPADDVPALTSAGLHHRDKRRGDVSNVGDLHSARWYDGEPSLQHVGGECDALTEVGVVGTPHCGWHNTDDRGTGVLVPTGH